VRFIKQAQLESFSTLNDLFTQVIPASTERQAHLEVIIMKLRLILCMYIIVANLYAEVRTLKISSSQKLSLGRSTYQNLSKPILFLRTRRRALTRRKYTLLSGEKSSSD
jgi:hypothetical protein